MYVYICVRFRTGARHSVPDIGPSAQRYKTAWLGKGSKVTVDSKKEDLSIVSSMGAFILFGLMVKRGDGC